MAGKGGSRHRKRLNTPKFMPILKKKNKFIKNTTPGRHAKSDCLPLIVVLRDLLEYGKYNREIKFMLNNGDVLVNGKPSRDPGMAIGLMDVVSFPAIDQYFRILPKTKGGVLLYEISEKNAKFKLCQIKNKTTLKGGVTQLNLHDGRNIVVEESDNTDYKTMGTVVIEF